MGLFFQLENDILSGGESLKLLVVQELSEFVVPAFEEVTNLNIIDFTEGDFLHDHRVSFSPLTRLHPHLSNWLDFDLYLKQSVEISRTSLQLFLQHVDLFAMKNIVFKLLVK